MIEIICRIIMFIYAGMMAIATIAAMQHDENKQKNYYSYNILTSLLVFVGVLMDWHIFIVIAILSLLTYQILAIYRGLSTQSFHWQHHLIRFVLTILFSLVLILI